MNAITQLTLPNKEKSVRITDLPRVRELIKHLSQNLPQDKILKLRAVVKLAFENNVYIKHRGVDTNDNSLIETLFILLNELGLKDESLVATLLFTPLREGVVSIKEIEADFGKEVTDILNGLIRTNKLIANEETIISENYMHLVITLAEDFRVILIRLAHALNLMRQIDKLDSAFALSLALKVKHIYAPLAHKLGLYKIKLEFDDLYLKYSDRDAYDHIIEKLKDSEQARNKFIKDFIKPINEKLKTTDLKYELKGRVKSISSIDNKLKKQKVDLEDIYDIFAIRIILDSESEKEKAECWQVYSMITDMYTPNPNRFKDWLSIPKSNGYESLHTTVMGPKHKWVEVQIRTKRMDEIAERGLAAHWKYKGLRSQSKVDEWLKSLREVLDNKNIAHSEKMEDFKMDIYQDEIYVFTPKGDLHKLPKGASVLDFAFAIHTKVGSTCISGKVNDKNVSIKHTLQNGDQVNIITSPNQHPKQDWLQYVHTVKAKNKIRQYLKEEKGKHIEIAKELLIRRFKNKKIEMNDNLMLKTINKFGYKNLTNFYIDITDNKLDVTHFVEEYSGLSKKILEAENAPIAKAETFVNIPSKLEENNNFKDELILDSNLTGIAYELATCCKPIFGDDVFAFVSSKGIKIHRRNCPNASDMLQRFPYRVIPAKWNSSSGFSNYSVALNIVGNDDISVINTITSIISKEQGVDMKGISIESEDSIFQGTITVRLTDKDKLNKLTKKIKSVKGVKSVIRGNIV